MINATLTLLLTLLFALSGQGLALNWKTLPGQGQAVDCRTVTAECQKILAPLPAKPLGRVNVITQGQTQPGAERLSEDGQLWLSDLRDPSGAQIWTLELELRLQVNTLGRCEYAAEYSVTYRYPDGSTFSTTGSASWWASCVAYRSA